VILIGVKVLTLVLGEYVSVTWIQNWRWKRLEFKSLS